MKNIMMLVVTLSVFAGMVYCLWYHRIDILGWVLFGGVAGLTAVAVFGGDND